MEMTQKQLQELHSLLLDMLRDFDRLCRNNGIDYFLGGGTLLGAVRHGGFIPWDDDVDLMMTRENYDKLCALPREALPQGWFLQTYQTDPHYHGDMAKLRLDGTVYATEFSSRFPQMHQGVFLDIFAHDLTAKRKLGQKLHIFATTLTRSMVFHKWEGTPMQFYGKHKLACRLVTGLIRILPMGFLEGLREWTYRWHRRSKSGLCYDGMGMHLQHGVFPKAWLEEGMYVNFQGVSLRIPKEYHNYLKFSYGDYMRLPKEDERTLHHIERLDLGSR